MRQEEGNGKAMPCYITSDCPLLEGSEKGNGLLTLILAELKTLNGSLVGPATGRKQVSSSIFFLTTGILGLLVLVLILRDSQKDFHATGLGTSIHVEGAMAAEKKTE